MEHDFLTLEILKLLGRKAPLIKFKVMLPLAESIARHIKTNRKHVLPNLELDVNTYLWNNSPSNEYTSNWTAIFQNSTYSDVERALNDFTRVLIKSV